jgi:hypothetical protein
VDLSLAIVTINGWNRLTIGLRSEVGGYRPGMAVGMLKRLTKKRIEAFYVRSER